MPPKLQCCYQGKVLERPEAWTETSIKVLENEKKKSLKCLVESFRSSRFFKTCTIQTSFYNVCSRRGALLHAQGTRVEGWTHVSRCKQDVLEGGFQKLSSTGRSLEIMIMSMFQVSQVLDEVQAQLSNRLLNTWMNSLKGFYRSRLLGTHWKFHKVSMSMVRSF